MAVRQMAYRPILSGADHAFSLLIPEGKAILKSAKPPIAPKETSANHHRKTTDIGMPSSASLPGGKD
jgi:hypothetical protein